VKKVAAIPVLLVAVIRLEKVLPVFGVQFSVKNKLKKERVFKKGQYTTDLFYFLILCYY
jgi:hypothetical protein